MLRTGKMQKIFACSLLAALFFSRKVDADIDVVLISNDITVNTGESTVLTCVGLYDVNDTDLHITWMRNGQVISTSSLVFITEQIFSQGQRLFLISFLQLCNLQYSSSGSFTCSFSNTANTVNSTVDLIVNGYAELVVLTNDTTASNGENVLFACVGSGEPDIDISWSRDGSLISNSSSSVIYEEYFTQGSRQFKRSYLQLCNISACKPITIQCSVSNGRTSMDGSLVVTITDPVELVLQSNSTTLSEGSGTVLICVGHGHPDLSITWKYNDEVITNSSTKYIIESTVYVGGRTFTESFLYLCDLESCDSGTYTCTLGTGSCSAEDGSFDVVVEGGPEIVLLSNDTSVKFEESVELVCIGIDQSITDLSIKWFKNGQMLYNTTTMTIVENIINVAGRLLKGSFLRLCDIQPFDGGRITCSVGRQNCSNSSSLDLSVIYNPVNVEIVNISIATYLSAGRTALIFCDGLEASQTKITWSYDGKEISNSTLHEITEQSFNDGGREIIRSTLQLFNIQKCTSGDYLCTVSNQTSSIHSAVPVNISSGNYNIVELSNNTRVDVGKSSTLICIGFGEPISKVNITWSQDNQPLSNSSNVTIIEDVYTHKGRMLKRSSLIQEDIQIENEGAYKCTVGVEHCSTSSSLSLSVKTNTTSSRRLSPGTVAAVAVIATAGGVAATVTSCGIIAYILKYAKKVKILKKAVSKVHKIAKEVKGGSDDDDDDDDDDQNNDGNEKGSKMKYAKKGKGIIVKVINKIKRARAERQRKARREASAKAKADSKDRKGSKSSKHPSNDYDTPVIPQSAPKKSPHGAAKKSPHGAAKKGPHGSAKKNPHKKSPGKSKENSKKNTEIKTYANNEGVPNNDISQEEEAIYEEID